MTVQRGDDRITWSTTAANGWSCRRSYRVVANLAANAVVCSDKAAVGAATALTDFVIANATKQALLNSGKMIPWHVVTISTDGAILDE